MVKRTVGTAKGGGSLVLDTETGKVTVQPFTPIERGTGGKGIPRSRPSSDAALMAQREAQRRAEQKRQDEIKQAEIRRLAEIQKKLLGEKAARAHAQKIKRLRITKKQEFSRARMRRQTQKQLRITQRVVEKIITQTPESRKAFKFLTKGKFKFKGDKEKQIQKLPIPQRDKDKLRLAIKAQEKSLDILAKVSKGFFEGLREEPEKTAIIAVSSYLAPGATKVVGGLKIVKKVVKIIPKSLRNKGAGAISKGLTALYVTSTGLTIAGTEKGKRFEKSGRILSTEVAPFKIGSRLGVQGLLRKEIKKDLNTEVNKLSKNKRAAFLDYMKQAEIFSKFEPIAKNIKLNNIESISSGAAQKQIRSFLKKSKGNIIVGGSVAQTSQVKVQRKLGDMDLYIESGSINKVAKQLADKLKKAGVKRVSNVRGQVTIDGRKSIEFHNVDRVLTNIKEVIPSWQNPRRYFVTTPEGIKIQRIGLQAQRKLVAAFADPKRFASGKYKKDLKDFKDIADKIFRNAERKARTSFFFKGSKIKSVEKLFKRRVKLPKPKPTKKTKPIPKPKKLRIIRKPKPKPTKKPRPIPKPKRLITTKRLRPKPKKPSKPRRRGPSQRPKKPKKPIRIIPSQPPPKPKRPRKPRRVPPSQPLPKPKRSPRPRPPFRPTGPGRTSPPSQPPSIPKKIKRRPPSRKAPPIRPRPKRRKKPIIVPRLKLRKKRLKIKKKIRGHNVFAKPIKTLRGKKAKRLIKVNKVPLTKRRAKDLRNYVVDTSLSRTAKIKPTTKKARSPKLSVPSGYAKRTRGKFRRHRIKKGKRIPLKKGKVIELSKNLLDTIQEKNKITLRRRIKQITKRPKRTKRGKKR